MLTEIVKMEIKSPLPLYKKAKASAILVLTTTMGLVLLLKITFIDFFSFFLPLHCTVM